MGPDPSSTYNRTSTTLDQQIRRGLSWNVANLLINKGAVILVRLLLARLLVPEYFGLISMIMILLGLVKIFAELSLSNALIQRKRDLRSLIRYDSAFWFLLGSGISWTLLFIIAGVPLLIWLNEEPRLREIAIVMSVSVLLHTVSVLPSVRLTRRMRFKSQVIAELVAVLVASMVTIGLAISGAGVWALVLQELTMGVVKSAMLWRSARWRPRYRFSWVSLNDLLEFSGWIFGTMVLHHIRINIDKAIVGALFGPSLLGIYSIAYLLTETLRGQLASIFEKIMLPAYSKLQNEPMRLQLNYLYVTKNMCALLFPFQLIMIIYAESVVGLLFSDIWSEAAKLIAILSIGGVIYALFGPSQEVMQGIGRARELFLTSFCNFIFVGIPTVIFLPLNYGISGAAWAVTITFASMRLTSFFIIRQYIYIGFIDMIKATGPALTLLFIGGFVADIAARDNPIIGSTAITASFIILFLIRRRISDRIHAPHGQDS